MADALRPAPGPSGNGSPLLLLSLKLILLAFFILLNALSELEEERIHAVLSSVHQTFRGQPQPLPRPGPADGSVGLLPRPDVLVAEVGGMFDSVVPPADRRLTRRADSIVVEIAANSLFIPGTASLRPDRIVPVQRLAQALAARAASGSLYELAFLHGVPAPAPAAEAGETARLGLAARRAALLVERLAEQELPARVLSVGLLPGRPQSVRFVLTMREEAGASVPAEAPAAPVEGAQ